jgi:hypothetical protein
LIVSRLFTFLFFVFCFVFCFIPSHRGRARRLPCGDLPYTGTPTLDPLRRKMPTLERLPWSPGRICSLANRTTYTHRRHRDAYPGAPTLEPGRHIYIYIYIYTGWSRTEKKAEGPCRVAYPRGTYPGGTYPGAPTLHEVAYPGARRGTLHAGAPTYPAAAGTLQGRSPPLDLARFPSASPSKAPSSPRASGPQDLPQTPAPGYPAAPYGPSPGRSRAPRPRGSRGPPGLGSRPHSRFPQNSFAWETGQIDSRETTYPVPTLEQAARRKSSRVEVDRLAFPLPSFLPSPSTNRITYPTPPRRQPRPAERPTQL